MKLKLFTALLAAVTILAPLSAIAETTPNPAEVKRAAVERFGKLPLSFEPTESPSRFLAHSGGYSVSVGVGESWVAVADPKSGTPHTFRFAFEKANPAAPLEAIEPLPGVTNYYLGADASKWRVGVKNYAKLRAQGVYPGVDVVYYGDHRRLEFDLVVAPQADPSVIALTFSGMEKFYKDASGDLVAEVGGRPIRFAKPYAYQRIGGVSHPVAAEYELSSAGRVQLHLGAYDRSSELIIDPVVSYATFLGGNQLDTANGVAVDSTGSAYVTGQTCSGGNASGNFPPAALYNNGSFSGSCDAYVTKFSPDGTTFEYTTILGGSNPANATAVGNGIALDSANQAYIVGTTNFRDMDVQNAGGYRNTWQGGDSDAFIAILATTTGAVVRTTYLGGSGADAGYGIAVDTQKNVIAVGQTCSNDFPSYYAIEVKVEYCVAFITKLDNGFHIAPPIAAGVSDLSPAPAPPSGATYYFSGTFGGQPVPPAVTSVWEPSTLTPTYFYPGTIVYDDNIPPNVQVTYTGGISGQVAPAWSKTKLDLTYDNTIVWENIGTTAAPTFATSEAYGVALDPLGDVFVAGGTNTADLGGNPPYIYSYYQGTGAWVLKLGATTGLVGGALNPNGNWVYGAALEKTPSDTSATVDAARAIAVDASGKAYVTGTATGTLFGTSSSSYKPAATGGQDAFLVRMSTSGGSIDYATYLGGSGNDQGLGIAVEASGTAYVTGSTQSIDFPLINPLENPNSQPVTNAPLLSLSGARDAFITKFTSDGTALIFSAYVGGSDIDQGNAIAIASDKNNHVDMYLAGSTSSQDFESTLIQESPLYPNPSYVPPQTYGGGGDAFVAKVAGASLPTVTVAPGSLDFANQDVGTRSVAVPVQYTNDNSISSVNISAVTFTGDFSQAYTAKTPQDCTPGPIAANAACNIWVVFSPTAQGNRTGTLTITDDVGTEPHLIWLTGQGATPYDAFSPLSLTFPAQVLETPSSPLTVTLQNTGKGTLFFNSIATSGDFSQTNTCTAQVAPGGTCTFSVVFTPTDIGTRNGSLTITDNSADSPHVIGFTGTVALVNSSITNPASLSLTFASSGSPQPLGVASASQTVTVKNNDPAHSLIVSGAVISGDFQVSANNCIAAVAPSGSCTILVTFTPTASGTRSGSLVISGDGTVMPVTISLTGTGAAGTGSIQIPSTLDFGTQQAINTPVTKTLTLGNGSSTNPLGITGISITAGNADGTFTVSNNCPLSLAASATCQVSVTFTPTKAGTAESATLTVSATGVASVTVALTGTGISGGGGGTTPTTGDFTMTASTTGVSVVEGSTAVYNFSITPQNGSKDTVTFACTKNPVGSTCSITPSQVVMDGSTVQPVTLIVGTTGGSGTGAKSVAPRLIPRSIFFALLPFSLVGMLLIKKRRGSWLALMLVVICLLMGMTACGGSNSTSSSDSGLAPASYEVDFTATSSADAANPQTIKLTLIVSKQ
jgi:hypothetical protein